MDGPGRNWLILAGVALMAGLAYWWWPQPARRSEPARHPPTAESRPAGERAEPQAGTTEVPSSTSLPVPSETELRRGAAPQSSALSARHDRALERLREDGGVPEAQSAFLALLHPYTSEQPLRAGLAILGGRPDQVQRDVFQALRGRIRPEVREALERMAAHDPSPQVRRAAGLALEVVEEGNPDPER